MLPVTSRRNEFIRGSINSTHARRGVRKGRFDAEKRKKGRKIPAVQERVPRKQGLKPGLLYVIGAATLLFKSEFHENKD